MVEQPRLRAFQNQRLPLQGFYPYVVMVLLAFLMADLANNFIRPYMIPQSSPSQRTENFEPPPYVSEFAYNEILDRNIFNSDGVIPEITGPAAVDNLDLAQLTGLPVKLIGTIVHINPAKSVASIEYQGKVDSFIPNWEKEGLFQVIKIKRKRVYFRNLQNNRPEYVEIKDENAIRMKTETKFDGPVQINGNNNFTLNRGELDSQLENINEILTQARGIPNFVGGKPDGFRIVEIVPGSIIDKLGIKNGDVIKGVDGEPLTSVSQVLGLYQGVRERSTLSLQVDRGGSVQTFNYNIR